MMVCDLEVKTKQTLSFCKEVIVRDLYHRNRMKLEQKLVPEKHDITVMDPLCGFVGELL